MKHNQKEVESSSFVDLERTLELYCVSYFEISKLKGYDLKLHSILNPDTGIFLKLLTSHFQHVLTVYPVFQNEKIKNFESFKEIGLKSNSQLLEKEEDVLLTEFEDLNPKTTVFDSFDEDESSSSKRNDEKNSKTMGLKQSKSPPFSSNLLGFELLDYYVLSQMASAHPIVFTSATFNDRHIEYISDEFYENVRCVKALPSSEKLDSLCVVISDVDYFSNTRASWKNFWNLFGKKYFDEITTPSIARNDPEYSLLMLPSDRKATLFFEKCLTSKNKFFTFVQNRVERTDFLSFREDGIHSGEYSCRVSSIQSSISCGLNLPNHKFLFVSFDVYKLVCTLYRHLDKSVINAQTVEAYTVLKQGIGRIARKTQYEKENPSAVLKRILFLSKYKSFPGLISVFKKDFEASYKNIQIVNLSQLEKEIANIFRRNKGLSSFICFKNENEDFKNIFPINIETSEDFRFLTFEHLISYLKADNVEQLDMNVIFIYFKWLHFVLILCDIAQRFSKNLFEKDVKTTKKNSSGLPSIYETMRTYNIEKKDENDRFVYTVIKDDLTNFLQIEKECDFLFFRSLLNENQEKGSFLILQKLTSLENISRTLHRLKIHLSSAK